MSYSSRANVQIRKILVGRGNTTVSGAHTGVRGEITMDTDIKALRVHDGVQVGGYLMAGQGWVEQYVANATFGTSSYGDANVAAYLLNDITVGNITFSAGYALPNTIGAPGTVLTLGGQGSSYWESTISVGNTAPALQNLWFNTDDGRTYVYSNDAWVDANPTAIAPPSTYLGNLTVVGETISYANGQSILDGIVGGGNPFDQDLNTTNGVTFANVSTTIGYISQINGTNPDGELIIQSAGIYNWNFAANGALVMPAGNFNASPAPLTSRIQFSGNAVNKILSDDTLGLRISIGDTGTSDWYFHSDGNLYMPQTEETYGRYGGIVFNWAGSSFNSTSLLPTGTYYAPNLTINTSNLNLDSSHTWTFDNSGNLTLPGNDSFIKYANGVSILDGIAGGGTYGNTEVSAYLLHNRIQTLESLDFMYTGMFGTYPYMGLELTDQNTLAVRVNDSSGDYTGSAIEVDRVSKATTFYGTINANSDINAAGNLTINNNIYSLDSTVIHVHDDLETFGAFTAQGIYLADGGSFISGNGNTAVLTAHANLQITVDGGTTWLFDANGNLVLPGPLQSSTGTLTFQSNVDRPDLAWTIMSGDESGIGVSVLYAPPGDDQHVGEILFSGTNGGGALVYAGNIGTSFDNAFNLIAFGTDTNVKISTGNGDWQWTFGNTGNLTTPYGSLTLDSGYETGIAGFIAPTGGVALGSTMLYNSGNIASQILQNREAAGGTVQISTYQDTADPAKTWTFDATGNLTVPADSTVKSASGDLNLYATGNVNIESKGHTFIFDTDTVGRFIMPPSGVIAGRASVDGEYDSNGLNIFVGNITTEVGSNWRFDATGNLTLPTDANINFANGVNILSTIVAGSTYSNANANALFTVTSISAFKDVDTVSTPPTTGQVLKWNGTKWAPGIDATTGGAGTEADTLDGQHGDYYLNYLNFSNVPDLSIYATTTNLQVISANLGAYQIWANSTFGTSSYGDANVAAYLLANPQGSTYSNSNVASYLTEQGIAAQIQSDYTESNSANVAYIKNKPDLSVYSTTANAAAQAVWLSNLQSNVQTISANLGAYQTWANANVTSLQNQITGANSTIQTISANLGGYQTWANLNYLTSATTVTINTANVAYYPNVTATASASTFYPGMYNAQTGNLATFTSANLTYQPSTGNLSTTGNIVTTGNVYVLGGALRTTATTANLFNTIATTVYIAGGATIGTYIGNASGVTQLYGNVQGSTNGFAIGYRDIPQVSFSGNTTISLADAGKHYYSTQSTNFTLTVANNSSVAFSIGAAINIVNQGTGTITIAPGVGVTMYLAGNSTSGSRTLASYGMATIQKVATDTWFAVGVGLA